MAHTTLVNVDIETAPKLASFIADLIEEQEEKHQYLDECKAMIEAAQTYELLSKFLEKSDLILSMENGQDAEGSFQAIVSILYTLQEEDKALSITNTTVEKLCSNNESKCALRLKILVTFFNLLTNVQFKLTVLRAIFKYAIDTNQTVLIGHFHGPVTRWVEEWNLSNTDKRMLYHSMSDILMRNGDESLALQFLIKYLNTFGKEECTKEAVQFATSAVINAIKSPAASFTDRSLLHQSLSKIAIKDSTLEPLVELLRIICAGDIDSLSSFQKSNGSLLSAHDISVDTILHSMKLMKLCLLAARATADHSRASELSYADIAEALEVNEDEVEVWVVDAISSELMEATMDQLRRVVVVSRCARVSFEADQWVSLQHKLSTWHSSMSSLLDLIQKHNA
mmetsp:Transcript_15868/g.23898  ORF Transcript_15868/g.23898 Transcript_15868/m.23898 type:complete len:396 (+) Transcript_15868:45-1232(+)